MKASAQEDKWIKRKETDTKQNDTGDTNETYLKQAKSKPK